MYDNDNGLWDAPAPHSNTHDFLTTAAWTFAGVMVGNELGKTRFGHWFNTSKFIGFIFTLIKLGLIGLALFYVYCVIQVW